LGDGVCVVLGNPGPDSTGNRCSWKLNQKSGSILIDDIGDDFAWEFLSPVLGFAFDSDVVAIHDIRVARAESYVVLRREKAFRNRA
jgi:hypothetical protein